MKKIEDASGEKRVDWDKEKDAGHLVDVSGQPGRPAVQPGVEHVQGVPLTQAEKERRKIPAHVAQAIAETGRDPRAGPQPKVGLAAPPGGWPRFGPDGIILR